MKSFLLSGLMLLSASSLVLAARGSKEQLATPIFEDQNNQTEIFSVSVGTYNSVKLYTPRQARHPVEERKVLIENLSSTRRLFITTWSVPTTEWLSSTQSAVPGFALNMATPTINMLELPASTTFYGRFERGTGGGVTDALTGASSDSIRGLVQSFNEALRP